jgi:PAS domain S-box-containing protein/putative nucleotidyltransferase with HDIG domain
MEGILAIVLQGGMVYNRELVLNHKTGRPIELSLAAAPVRDSIGAIGGAIIILNDITERKRAEEALRKSEAHLANAQRIAKMGSWVWDPRTDSGEWSVEVSEMLGLSPDNRSGSLSFFFSVVHPEDREIAERNTMTALAEKKSIDYEHRIQRADGAIIWVRQRAEVTFDKDGKPLMMLGTMQDITERKRQEQEVLIQLERVRALHEIDAAIASTFDLNIGLEFILGKVLNLLNAPAAAVLSLEPDTHMFHYAACKGFRKPVVGYDIFGMAEVIARMITHPQPVMQNDLSEVVGPSPDFYRFEGFRAAHSVPLMVKGQLRGLLQVFHREPFAPEPDWMEFFETLAAQVAIAIDNITLYNNLQYSNMELRMAYDATIEGWSRALDLRDKETEGHTLRVTELTLQFFRRIGMSDEGQMKHIRWGALLHDIGKMGVPDHILLKDGPLSDEEWAIMKQHPVYARDLIVPISFLKDAIDIPYCHHERWDGMGYPQGLRGDEIPLAARLFALVDVWDALRSDRPYRKAWTSEKTAEYIRSLSGKQFDPSLVETFLEMVEKGG